MAVERVFLIRHGQTDWNATGRWQGFEPVALNDEGWEQARILAAYLRRCHARITALFTSDLPRALQTAAAVGNVFGLQPRVDLRWREINVGIFQGHTRAEIEIKYPAEWSAYTADRSTYPIPHGESLPQLRERAYAAWQDVITSPQGPELAIFSHGGTIKQLLLELSDENPEIAAAHLPNTSISTVELNGQGWQVTAVGETPHLLQPPHS